MANLKNLPKAILNGITKSDQERFEARRSACDDHCEHNQMNRCAVSGCDCRLDWLQRSEVNECKAGKWKG